MGLFSSAAVEAFARELAQDICKRFPPTLANDPQRMVSPKRLTTILEETCEKAKAYREQNNLGWFRKSQLANDFRWELVELDYNDKFVEVAVEAVVVYMTKKESTPPAVAAE